MSVWDGDDRFSLLLLEEGEYYFRDYACHLLRGAARCAPRLCLCSALWTRPLRGTGPCRHGTRLLRLGRADSCGAARRAAQAGGAPQAVQRVAVLRAAQLRGADYAHPVPRDHVHGQVPPARPPSPSRAGAATASTSHPPPCCRTTNPVQARRGTAGGRAAGASRRAAAWRRRGAWRARSCSRSSAPSAWR
jgi:hypothetical protein